MAKLEAIQPVLMSSNVDALYAELTGAFKVEGPWGKPGDTPWGTREFHARDPDGNGLQFYRAR